jgi:F420-dependent oxidoreductase-like protein
MSESLRLGLHLGYWGPKAEDPLPLALEAERLGFDSIWAGEAYGSDALTPLTWIGAHTSRIKLGTNLLQLSARTPANLAMAITTMDHLSQGRMIVGVGVSGPQVVEGWYGEPFAQPLGRSRAYIEVLRAAFARMEPITRSGPHHELPYTGPGSTGLGKPLKLITRPFRPDVPILLGAGGQKNVALAAEIADGWLPSFYSPFREEIYDDALAGIGDGFEIPCTVTVVLDDDVAAGLAVVKRALGFYIGGMGATGRNFHLDQIVRLGFETEAFEVQALFLDGKVDEACAHVPDALADEISLVGPKDRIRERLDAWRASRATSLLINTRDPAALELLASELGSQRALA